MFYTSLRKEAIRIHDQVLERYNASYEGISKSCEELYETRTRAVGTIVLVESVINSIANTPKEFGIKLGEIEKEIREFKTKEEYAKDAYEAAAKAGINIVGGAAAGISVATMAPIALMSVATTFGTASTGTAISALSGAAAQKAAVAWIGRTFAGFAAEGAGLAAGNAFLTLAGPLGWGITAVSTGISLISLTKKNKEIADEAVDEAKEIARARESLDEASEKIGALIGKTTVIVRDINARKNLIMEMMDREYISLGVEEKMFLGTLVNNSLSLSRLLNETIG